MHNCSGSLLYSLRTLRSPVCLIHEGRNTIVVYRQMRTLQSCFLVTFKLLLAENRLCSMITRAANVCP